MRIYGLLCGVVALSVLSACGGGDPLPTLIPVSTVATIDAATPTIEAVAVTVTATRPAERPTLPPTFTPTTVLTEVPTPTEVFPTSTLFVSVATIDVNCNSFRSNFDLSNTIFNLGEAPKATWSAVPDAQLYRLIVKEASGQVVYDQLLQETTTTFSAELFKSGKNYGWEVYPINARGDQMCYSIGLELIPVTPFGS